MGQTIVAVESFAGRTTYPSGIFFGLAVAAIAAYVVFLFIKLRLPLPGLIMTRAVGTRIAPPAYQARRREGRYEKPREYDAGSYGALDNAPFAVTNEEDLVGGGSGDLDKQILFLRENTIGRRGKIASPFFRGGVRKIYADYTASGQSLQFIEDYITQKILTEYANSHTEDSFTGLSTTNRFLRSLEIIRDSVGGDDNYAAIAIGTGVTAGIERIQNMLGVYISPAARQYLERHNLNIDLPDRPVVFIGPYEHNSNALSWRESLAEVVRIDLDKEGAIDQEMLQRELMRYRNRRKIGFFSAASNVTGRLTDIKGITRILKQHGALVFFDYAAAAPYEEINVRGEGPYYIDGVVISTHKYLGGPGGCGVLVIRKDAYSQRLPPSFPGGGTVWVVSGTYAVYDPNVSMREHAGTPGIMQAAHAALAMQLKAVIGVDNIHRLEYALAGDVMHYLTNDPNIVLYGSPDLRKRAPIFSFNIMYKGNYLAPRFVTQILSDLFGIQTRGGCACAGPYGHDILNINEHDSEIMRKAVQNREMQSVKPGWVRLNVHYTFTREEVAYILSALKLVSKYGYKLMQLYTLDLYGGGWHFRGQPLPPTEFSISAAARNYRRHQRLSSSASGEDIAEEELFCTGALSVRGSAQSRSRYEIEEMLYNDDLSKQITAACAFLKKLPEIPDSDLKALTAKNGSPLPMLYIHLNADQTAPSPLELEGALNNIHTEAAAFADAISA